MTIAIRTRVRAKLRSGQPSTAAPALPSIGPGIPLEALRIVTGENVAGVDQWYELAESRFV